MLENKPKNWYKHWRTPKLVGELAAVKNLQGMPERKGKRARQLASLENKRLRRIQREIEEVLSKRRKRRK